MNIDKNMYHEKIRKIDVQNEINSLIDSAKDDVVVILRIHLMCENILEAWISAAIGRMDFFTSPRELRLKFSDKLAMAYNLSLPGPAYKFFKEINSVRNQFSHKLAIKDIAVGLTDSLKGITSGFSFAKSYEISLDAGEYKQYKISSPNTPERIKLCLLFVMFTLQLSMELEPKQEGDDGEKGTVKIEFNL